MTYSYKKKYDHLAKTMGIVFAANVPETRFLADIFTREIIEDNDNVIQGLYMI